MGNLNFTNRAVKLDIKNWGNQLIITVKNGPKNGFNVSEMYAIEDEAERLLKLLGCGEGKVGILIRETNRRLTIVVTPPTANK